MSGVVKAEAACETGNVTAGRSSGTKNGAVDNKVVLKIEFMVNGLNL